MLIAEVKKSRFTVEFIDLENAGLPEDVCLIRVTDNSDNVVQELILTETAFGVGLEDTNH